MRFIQLLLLSSFILILLQSNKGGRNEATTGAPFETNKTACASCHSGGSFTPEIKFSMTDKDGNLVTDYVSNETYTLEFNLSSSSGSPKYYGFQAVIVDASNKTAGKFIANGQNVRNITIQSKSYLTQSTARVDGTFSASWLAPDNIGNLKVYVAGIAANGNNNTSGDKAIKTEFELQAAGTSSYEKVEFTSPKLVCNAGCENLQFTFDVNDILIFDVNGRTIQHIKSKVNSIDVSNITSGMYFINFEYEGKRYSESFIR